MANTREHRYAVSLTWNGNLGTGTSGYRDYSRNYEIVSESKPAIQGSADPAFRGDRSRWNPNEQEDRADRDAKRRTSVRRRLVWEFFCQVVFCLLPFLVWSGKTVPRPVACDQVRGARGRCQGTEMLAQAPVSGHQRTEPFVAKPAPESSAVTEQLMEEVCDRENP